MLRWMLGAGRRKIENKLEDSDTEPEPEETNEENNMTHESWLDWIIRTTGFVEEQMHKAGLDDWVTAVHKKKWRWAGHIARRTDGRWATKLLTWVPEDGCRHVGRPCKKWSTDLDAFFFKSVGYETGSWIHVAQDRQNWAALEREYIEHAW